MGSIFVKVIYFLLKKQKKLYMTHRLKHLTFSTFQKMFANCPSKENSKRPKAGDLVLCVQIW